ncbi:hypothetical protein D3C78_1623250 [compost metagenome]
MLEVGKAGNTLALQVVPAGPQAGGARQLQVTAIGVAWQAGVARGGIDILVSQARAHGGVGRDVPVDGAVQYLVLALGRVIEVLAVLQRRHGAPPHGARRVQRAAHVHLPAVVVPAAG